MKLRISYKAFRSLDEHFLYWLQGFAEIADGLVTLLSLGFFMSNFELNISYWRAMREFKKQKLAKRSN